MGHLGERLAAVGGRLVHAGDDRVGDASPDAFDPRLDMLADGNPGHGIDFRRLYASALETWWGLDAAAVLGGRFAPVDFIKSA